MTATQQHTAAALTTAAGYLHQAKTHLVQFPCPITACYSEAPRQGMVIPCNTAQPAYQHRERTDVQYNTTTQWIQDFASLADGS